MDVFVRARLDHVSPVTNIPPSVLYMGERVDSTYEEIREVVDEIGRDCSQCHAEFPRRLLRALK